MRLTDAELQRKEEDAIKLLAPNHWMRLVLRELIERRHDMNDLLRRQK